MRLYVKIYTKDMSCSYESIRAIVINESDIAKIIEQEHMSEDEILERITVERFEEL